MRHAGEAEMNSYEWSRLGPMGYLVEPKLYPIDVSSTPVVPRGNSIEMRNCRRTIEDKSDLPLNVEPITPLPPVDILRRINENRLRSTYQTDFGHIDDYPWVDYDDLMLSAGYRANRSSIKPREEVKCRERAKPPYLNGHEIPGRRLKVSSVFASNGSSCCKTKRRSGPPGTNLPLRPVKPKRVSRQSRDIDDDDGIGVGERFRNEYQSRRGERLGDVIADESRQVSRDATDDESSQILRDSTGDDRRRITKNTTDENARRMSGDAANDNGRKVSRDAANDKGRNVSRNASDDYEREVRGDVAADDKRRTSDDTTGYARGSVDSKSMGNGRRSFIDKQTSDAKKKVKENEDTWELIPSMPWTSEYQDIISRTADDILRSKLHYYGRLRLVTPNPDCP